MRRLLKLYWRPLLTLAAAVGIFSVSMLVFAQTPSPGPIPVPKPDVNETLAALISAVGGAAIPWAVWAIATKVLTFLPRATLPFLPLALGVGTDYLAKLASGAHSPIGAAGIAVIGMILHAVISTVSEHGLASGGGAIFKVNG